MNIIIKSTIFLLWVAFWVYMDVSIWNDCQIYYAIHGTEQ